MRLIKLVHWRTFFFFLEKEPIAGQGRLLSQVSVSRTVTQTTGGRTPLDEEYARCRGISLMTHSTHKRQTSMHLTGFNPTVPDSDLLQILAVDRSATGMGH
jgi:hypothetical protein